MADEIRATYDPNETLYAVIFNAAGQAWQTTTTSFVTYDDDNQANYDIALTEAGDDSGEYRGTFPGGISRRPRVRQVYVGTCARLDPVVPFGHMVHMVHPRERTSWK